MPVVWSGLIAVNRGEWVWEVMGPCFFRSFRRLHHGVGKHGPRRAVPSVCKDECQGPSEFARHDWIRDERIASCGCQPLVFRGEVLGVLAIFNRERCNEASFAWPGNVRELQNVIDRFAIVSHGGPLRLSDLLPKCVPWTGPRLPHATPWS